MFSFLSASPVAPTVNILRLFSHLNSSTFTLARKGTYILLSLFHLNSFSLKKNVRKSANCNSFVVYSEQLMYCLLLTSGSTNSPYDVPTLQNETLEISNASFDSDQLG